MKTFLYNKFLDFKHDHLNDDQQVFGFHEKFLDFKHDHLNDDQHESDSYQKSNLDPHLHNLIRRLEKTSLKTE